MIVGGGEVERGDDCIDELEEADSSEAGGDGSAAESPMETYGVTKLRHDPNGGGAPGGAPCAAAGKEAAFSEEGGD